MSKTTTIQSRILDFIEFLGITEREFARRAGISSGYLNSLKAGTNPGTKILLKILSSFPELNDQWLLNGIGEMTGSNSTAIDQVVKPFEGSTDNLVAIPITEIKAAAGMGYMNTEMIRSENDFIQLPSSLTKAGVHLCVRIKGNSMSPTLQDGGYVVIRLLDKSDWYNIVSDRVYVIVDSDNQTYLKRLRNRLPNGGFVVLTSDNPDKASYPSINLKIDEIVSVWYVEWYLSAKMPNIHDQFYSKLERLENAVDDINRKMTDLERLTLKK